MSAFLSELTELLERAVTEEETRAEAVTLPPPALPYPPPEPVE